jgi:hypothetical protein
MKEVFGMTGWEDMNNLIKTDLANTLSDVLEIVGGIRDAIKEIGTLDGFEKLAKTINKATDGLLQATGQLQAIQNTIAFIKGLTGGSSGGGLSEGNGQIGGGVAGLISSGKPKGFTVTTDNNGKVIGATRDGQDVLEEYLATIAKNAPKPITTTTPTSRTPSGIKKEAWAPIEMADLTLGTQKVQKVVEVTVDDAAALEQIREIEGVTIADKGMTITATDEALPKLREIEGVTIADKGMTITATDEALPKLREIEGVTIADKGMTITATDEALPKLREIEGVTIADKGMTITATDEALPKLREIEGVKLSDKVVDVVVNDNSDFLFGRSKQDVQKDLQRAQKAYDIAPDEWTRAEARKDVTRYQKELETMNGEGDVTKGLMKDAYTHDFGKDMDALSKELKNEQKTTQLSETEQVKQMGAMVGGIQQMVGGIAQLGIEIPEGFQSLLGGLQGVMTILQAIQTINTVGSVLGIFGNGGIVGRAANGMVIPGNSFSGDHLRMPVEGGGLIGVNSGELILNKAQQNAVARGLQEERGGGYSSTPYVDGEKIYLGMNNFLRRSGRGEIVTSRR